MAIEKLNDQLYEVSCDECGESETFVVIDWEDLMRQMEDAGWVKTKIIDEWSHFCIECSDDDEDFEDDDDDFDEDDLDDEDDDDLDD